MNNKNSNEGQERKESQLHNIASLLGLKPKRKIPRAYKIEELP